MKKINQQGFAMPVIILLLSLMAITAYSILSIAGTSIDQSFSNGYQATAESAARAGINYSKIQFNDAYCDNFSGTEETNLVNNDNYRLSFKIDVLSTSADGLSKTIRSTSKLYLPANASRPKITKTFGAVIFNASTDKCKNPNFYRPLVWLDASDNTSLLKPGVPIKTLVSSTNYGNLSDTSRDTIEERQDNGAISSDSSKSTTLTLHNCNPANFDNDTCNKNATKRLNVGMVFQNLNVPKNSTISSATLELQCSNNQSIDGLLTHKVRGFYQAPDDSNPALFNQSTNRQLKTILDTNALHTNASVDHSENSCNPSGTIFINVKDVVQEIINSNGWNPNDNNKASLGLAISYVNGFGSRSINKSGNKLSISYSTSATNNSGNNEAVGSWLDKSGNGNNAELAYGNAPNVSPNLLNNKPSLDFNNSIMSVPLSNELENKKEMTVFAVIKPNFASSANSGRIISAVKDSAENDETANQSIIPLMKFTDKTGFASQYAPGEAFGLNHECVDCANSANLLTSLFAKAKDKSVRSSLLINNQVVASNPSFKPAGTPYTFNLSKFYIGGTRLGALPGNGSNYLNGAYSEIIIYDKALTCRQINSINNYLRDKWGISNTVYPDACSEDVVSI